MQNRLLLSDETYICIEDFQEREKLLEEFMKLPNEFISEMRHFQPQIGCLNTCQICSKNAKGKIEYWTEKRIRNVVAAIKYRALMQNDRFPLLASGRKNHRQGVVFPYLDNDIGSYVYLDKFIQILFQELGVQTRISTIGYSRYNKSLKQIHKKISDSSVSDGLGGVRLSFTPYGKGWREEHQYSRDDYIEDMTHFFKVYKEYYTKIGCGYRKMCVEIRYSPLVVNSKVLIETIDNHMVICTNNYLYISENTDIDLKVAHISNPYSHLIELTQPPCYFYQLDLDNKIEDIITLKKIVEKFICGDKLKSSSKCEVYLMENYDGEYITINPKITAVGNWGMNIYPCVKHRKVSGYVVTERFLLNAMFQYKNAKGLSSSAKFVNATWSDVDNVLMLCNEIAEKYAMQGKLEKHEYIKSVIEPMIKGYVMALKKANYSAADFFDPDFTIDTGIICNLGRALSEFKGIGLKKDEPLTPAHERNYGSENSLMVQEGEVWRLSCGYNNTIIIQKLNLADTANICGQIKYEKIIQLGKGNEILDIADLETQYLIPGQRRK